MDIQEVECRSRDWIKQAQDRAGVGHVVMNLKVP